MWQQPPIVAAPQIANAIYGESLRRHQHCVDDVDNTIISINIWCCDYRLKTSLASILVASQRVALSLLMYLF
jgi:hypothetical protein